MRELVFIWWLFSATFALGQDPSRIPPDLSRLEKATSDQERMDLLNRIAFNHADMDPAKGVEYGLRALAIAQRLKDTQAIGVSRNTVGYCFTRLSRFASADSMYNLAMADLRRSPDRCAESLCWYNRGLNDQMQSKLSTTLENFLHAVQIGADCADRGQYSVRLYGLGSVYESMRRFPDALTYYQQAFAIDSARQDTARLAKEHIALGNILASMKRLDEAAAHYRSSVQCSRAVGDSMMTGYVLYNCASLEVVRQNIPEAVKCAEEAVAVFERLRRPAERIHTMNYLGYLYNEAKRYPDAERTLQATLRSATELGLAQERQDALQYLAMAQRNQGNTSAALRNFEAYIALKDSLAVEGQKKELAELTAKYETEKKEKALLEAKGQEAASRIEVQKQRTLKLIYLGCAVLLGLTALVMVGRNRMKRRTADALARTNAEIIRQKERAEESERTKDRFLANVSHEIRTPLNAILGFTGLLLEEPHDDRTQRFLTSIRDAGDNLLVVINDVLDISRMEAGRLALVKEPFELERCVRVCGDMLKHRAEEQHDRLVIEFAPGTPPWIMGDSARLSQILMNLLGNALKFTANGEVALRVGVTGDKLTFRVSDTGIGIPKEQLDNVFERFTQVATNDQRKYGGTGLGLAIVKELVTLHHGTVRVESEVGKGTTFIVELPCEPTTAAAKGQEAPRSTPLSNGSLDGRMVLVAEDNDLNAVVTMETMKRHYPGSWVVRATNGRDAADVILKEEGRIGLVLMDVQMPQLDGMAATREVRQAGSRVPIIALTASVLPHDLSRCLDAGMDACVVKPFKVNDLLHTIARLTGDTGTSAPSESTASDPYTELFEQLMPARLSTLREAHAQKDRVTTQRTVHAIRPQLVHRDAQRFAAACDDILTLDKSASAEVWDRKVERLVNAIEEVIA